MQNKKEITIEGGDVGLKASMIDVERCRKGECRNQNVQEEPMICEKN